LLACLIDYCRVNRFRYADGNVPRCEQPRLEVHEDVKTQEKLVEDTIENKEIEWILTATELHKTYDSNGLHAVCGNTLGVRKGEVFGLLGPNGAGKSTTFSMLSMDEPRSDGEIQVLGNDIENISLQKTG